MRFRLMDGKVLYGTLQSVVSHPRSDGMSLERVGLVKVDELDEYVLVPPIELGVSSGEEIASFLDRRIPLVLIDYIPERNVFIGSRKEALYVLSESWLERGFEEGDITVGIVEQVDIDGLTIDIGGVLAYMPANEFRHGYVEDVRNEVQRGDKVVAKIRSIDGTDVYDVRVELSKKTLEANPWEDKQLLSFVEAGTEHIGLITGKYSAQFVVSILSGLHVYATPSRRNSHLVEAGVGDKVIVRIRSVDRVSEYVEAEMYECGRGWAEGREVVSVGG